MRPTVPSPSNTLTFASSSLVCVDYGSIQSLRDFILSPPTPNSMFQFPIKPPKYLFHSLFKTVFFTVIITLLTTLFLLLWIHQSQADGKTVWGVDFSESQAVYLGLNPVETYSAIINDLGVKHIKIHINWNATEPTRSQFDFTSLDRMVREAEENDVELILVIGMKTGRWPECHTPKWFKEVAVDERQTEIIRYVSTLVGRYKNSDAVAFWQVENEPLLQFGTCSDWYYDQGTNLLKAEVAAVRAQDPTRKIILSDSGELSTWTEVAEIGDVVGVTMYRSSWEATDKTFGLNPYTFLAPEFYSAKAAFIQSFYGKPVISVELQAEPWASKGLAEASLAEQVLSMNPELFKENVEFAKQAGLGTYYFWGVEWWYYMKTTHNQPEIWESSKTVFAE